MRIAVVHNLPFGGAKRALCDWIAGLSQKHEIDMYTYTKENNKDNSMVKYIKKHYRLNDLDQSAEPWIIGKLLYLMRISKVNKKIAETINERQYDVAFVHECMFIQNPLVLKYLTIPCVFYSQDTPQRRYYEPGIFSERKFGFCVSEKIRNYYNKSAIKNADVVLASSYYTRESLQKIYGVNPEVVYYGIDPERFFPMDIDKGNFVLSVGRLHRTKGHDFIIKCLGNVDASIRPNLKIICEAEKKEAVSKMFLLAKEVGVNLSCEYGINDSRLRQLYNEAIFTVCAYVMEPLGFVPLESIACGTPVVGIKEGGMRETIQHNEVGLLADRDCDDVARKMELLLRNDTMRERLSMNCHDYINENWTINRSVLNIEKSLTKVMSRINN